MIHRKLHFCRIIEMLKHLYVLNCHVVVMFFFDRIVHIFGKGIFFISQLFSFDCICFAVGVRPELALGWITIIMIVEMVFNGGSHVFDKHFFHHSILFHSISYILN